MPKNSATGAHAPSPVSFRPVLVHTSPDHPPQSPEAEVLRLKAELARVKKELHELTLATREFVLSMI